MSTPEDSCDECGQFHRRRNCMTMKARSGIQLYDTTMEVDVTDVEGYATGRSVLVWLTIQVETDMNYGADADGRRGIPKIEHGIMNAWIDPHDLPKVSLHEAEQCIKEAESNFLDSSRYHL